MLRAKNYNHAMSAQFINIANKENGYVNAYLIAHIISSSNVEQTMTNKDEQKQGLPETVELHAMEGTPSVEAAAQSIMRDVPGRRICESSC